MSRKEQLGRLIRLALDEELQFADALTEAERQQEGSLESWSAKDCLAHNAAWKSRLADDLALAARGETPTRPEDYDRENARIYEQYRRHPWGSVLEMAQEACDSLVAQIEALGDEGLERTDVLPWQGENPLWREIAGTAFLHAGAHLAEYYRMRGEMMRAGSFLLEVTRASAQLDDSPGWQAAVQYNTACSHALMGEAAQAIEALKQALALNPGLIEWSQQDRDLESLHGETAYQALYTD